MKILMIPIHSVVDVITNSSSVIYTEASSGAAKVAREIINEILEFAESDKTADDLFTFEVVDMFDDMDGFFDCDDEYVISKVPPRPDYKNFNKSDGKTDWTEYYKAQSDYTEANESLVIGLLKGDEGFREALEDYGTKLVPTLVVTAKDGKSLALASKALRMFSQEAS